MVGEVVATGAPAGSAETPGEAAGGGPAEVVGDPVTACSTLLAEAEAPGEAAGGATVGDPVTEAAIVVELTIIMLNVLSDVKYNIRNKKYLTY